MWDAIASTIECDKYLPSSVIGPMSIETFKKVSKWKWAHIETVWDAKISTSVKYKSL